nr:pilin [Catenulispora pinistramenti]
MKADSAHRCRAVLLLAASAAALLFVCTKADAATFPVQPQVLAVATIGQVISNVRTWLVGLLASLATVFLTIGGARYLMAGGDPAEVEKGKTAMKSAAFGYALAVLAPVVVTVLQHLVGAGS